MEDLYKSDIDINIESKTNFVATGDSFVLIPNKRLFNTFQQISNKNLAWTLSVRSLNLILPAYGEYHENNTDTFCILTNRKLNESKILPYITISNKNIRGRYDGIDGFYLKTSDILNEYPLYKNINGWFIFYDNLSVSWKVVNGDPREAASYYVMLEN